jgi:hypothetical protein
MNDEYFMKISTLSKKKLLKSFLYLGEGGARIVFALNNDLVIKVPKNKFGIFQNGIENYIFNHAEERFKKYLCPVKWYRSELLVAVRAIPIDDDKEYLNCLRTFCGNIPFYEDILTISKTYFLAKDDIRATSSWGILNGEKVLIDYGCPSKQGHEFYKNQIAEKDTK